MLLKSPHRMHGCKFRPEAVASRCNSARRQLICASFTSPAVGLKRRWVVATQNMGLSSGELEGGESAVITP